MHIKIGVPIFAEDGQAGRVSRVILHPSTQELHGIVATEERLLPHDVVVPAALIASADEDGLTVRGTVEAISALEPFALSQYTEAPEDWIPPTGDASSIYLFPSSPYAVGAFDRPSAVGPASAHEVESLGMGDVDVSGSTLVYCGERQVGHLDRVFTEDNSDHVTHLVLQRGTMRRDIAVPVDRVSSIGDEGILLDLTEEELDNLPPIPA
jgi:uncharacterized protein YrrD